MFSSVAKIFTSLSATVDPDKFAQLWSPYIAASKTVSLPEGKKPSKLLDIPAVKGVVAIREDMLKLEIKPAEAAAYGSRLSLAEGLHSNEEAVAKYPQHLYTEGDTKQISEAMLKAIAVCKISKCAYGPFIDLEHLDDALHQFELASAQ